VVDVGAGTGLLALGAVGRVGPDGDVLAIDISADALEELRANTTAPNLSYLVGSAEVLPLMDEAVDAVVTRSVLIYVGDKAEAAREFHRVLRRDGRVSLFEPINSRNLRLYQGVDLAPLGELGERLRERTDATYADPEDPMLNFDESDLEQFFAEAGFVDVRLELGADEHEVQGERYLNQVGAPGRLTTLQHWQEHFSEEDADRLAEFVRRRTIPLRFPYAFLTARKR
jgi:arsenite methyltransferase